MLFDPRVLIEQPLRVLAVVAHHRRRQVARRACCSCSLFRYPLNTALTVSASLAQIGEFSFILAGLGVSLGLLPTEGQSLILAGALISIALNPLVFAADRAGRSAGSARARRWRARWSRRDDPLAELPMSTRGRFLSRQVVLVGYGRVGKRIADALRRRRPLRRRRGEPGAVEQLRARKWRGVRRRRPSRRCSSRRTSRRAHARHRDARHHRRAQDGRGRAHAEPDHRRSRFAATTARRAALLEAESTPRGSSSARTRGDGDRRARAANRRDRGACARSPQRGL